MTQVLRVTVFEDYYGIALLRVVVADDEGTRREVGFAMTDAQQVLDAADKLRAVGNLMLRRSPRPVQEKA